MWKGRATSCLFWSLVILLMCPLSVGAKGFSTIYVIGDSQSDQGNLFNGTGALKNSFLDLLSANPSIELPAELSAHISIFPIPDQNHYHYGRFSNGNNYVDWLAEKLQLEYRANPSISPSTAGGSNFAFGGARSTYNVVVNDILSETSEISEILASYNITIPDWSLNAEITAFKELQSDDPKALYIVYAGSNDLKDILDGTAPQGAAANLLTAIYTAIEAFIGAGARDILVPLIPDLSRVPSVIQLADVKAAALGVDPSVILSSIQQSTATLNYQILAMVQGYYSGRSDVNVMTFDTFSILGEIAEAPQKYGFTNVTEACYTGFVSPVPEGAECDNPDQYLFWDSEHPTTAAHHVIANLMLNTVMVGILADFTDEMTTVEGLPAKIKTILVKNLTLIKTHLTDKYRGNDLIAIANLKILAATLDRLKRSPLVTIDTDPLRDRALQLAEIAEGNLR